MIVDDDVAYCGGSRLDHAPLGHRGPPPRGTAPPRSVPQAVPAHARRANGGPGRGCGRARRTSARALAARRRQADRAARRGSTMRGLATSSRNSKTCPSASCARSPALEERDHEIREIERATVAAIASAERFIYIENQYITSKTACEALVARMRAQPSLEAIVVTTREPGGWLEAGTMGVGRQQFMAQFAAPGLAKRIQFVAPLARCSAADPETESIAPGGTLVDPRAREGAGRGRAFLAHRLVEPEQPLDGLRHRVRSRRRSGERGAAARHRVGPQSLARRALGQRREKRCRRRSASG